MDSRKLRLAVVRPCAGAEVANAQFGVDLSGHAEAEIISGIFTELQLQ